MAKLFASNKLLLIVYSTISMELVSFATPKKHLTLLLMYVRTLLSFQTARQPLNSKEWITVRPAKWALFYLQTDWAASEESTTAHYIQTEFASDASQDLSSVLKFASSAQLGLNLLMECVSIT